MDEFLDTPLYLQIATRIRHQIASGQLRSGDRLPSLRRGAERWGVHLHTVRRAYRSLESEGLVETRRGLGTRVAVTPGPDLADRTDSIDGFVEGIVAAAMQRFGVSASELASRIEDFDGPGSDVVWVLECSESLAASLAEQIGRWSGLRALPWLVQRAAEVPDGYHLATYYHYSEVREAFAGRRREPAFFGVSLEEENLKRLERRAQALNRLVLLSVDGRTGGAIGTEVGEVLDRSIEIDVRVTRRPQDALTGIPPAVPVLLSPENWDRLTPEEQADPRLFQLIFEPDRGDLARIAERFGWRLSGIRSSPLAAEGDAGRCIACAAPRG